MRSQENEALIEDLATQVSVARQPLVLWLENVERGSVITAAEYFRRIGYICKTFETTPKQLANYNEKEAGNFLLHVISHFEDKKSAGTNIKRYVRALKSWWSFNDIEIRKRIRIGGSNDYSRYENERVPTQAELGRILDVASIRAKVAIALVAFCGFRTEILGDYLGSDGLKVADLAEIYFKNGTLYCTQDESNDCMHIHFALALPQVIKLKGRSSR